MTFRKEEKIIISDTEISSLKNLIEKKGFKILHPKRKIESIYFENIDLRCFYESEEGILPRKKFRIRNIVKIVTNGFWNKSIILSYVIVGKLKIRYNKNIDKGMLRIAVIL